MAYLYYLNESVPNFPDKCEIYNLPIGTSYGDLAIFTAPTANSTKFQNKLLYSMVIKLV